MKQTLLTICLILFALPSWGESISVQDLLIRDGLFYKKFSDVPFSGEVSGEEQGKLKNGLREGFWTIYWDSGQLHSKGNYHNGKENGYWVFYFENGVIWRKADIKDGNYDGKVTKFHPNGKLSAEGAYNENKKQISQKIFLSI